MAKDTPQSARRVRWLLTVLFAAPLLVLLARTPASPVAPWLQSYLSLSELPADVQHEITQILFVPAAALLVVFVRLTLGLRILGPFRSILLAVAFQATGVLLGMIFLLIAVAIVTFIRDPIKSLRMPYYGRISVLLGGVAASMVGFTLAGVWLDWSSLHSIAYFPLVVLCLVGDAFARTIQKEGLRSALWRGGITAALAAVLTWAASNASLRVPLLNYPEVLLLQVGGIVVIAKYLAWRYFAYLNPAVGSEEEEDGFDGEESRSSSRKKKKKRLSAPVAAILNPASSTTNCNLEQVQQP